MIPATIIPQLHCERKTVRKDQINISLPLLPFLDLPSFSWIASNIEMKNS